MKRKIKDLTFAEIKRICSKHIIYNRMLCKPECSDLCPLLMRKNMMSVDCSLNHFGAYSYTKKTCCADFKENNVSDVDRFMNKKVKVEE